MVALSVKAKQSKEVRTQQSVKKNNRKFSSHSSKLDIKQLSIYLSLEIILISPSTAYSLGC